MAESTPQARLIAQWRHQALVAGQYSVECAITKAHEHHIAATEAMTLARCADELEAVLDVQPAQWAQIAIDAAKWRVQEREAALLPQPAPLRLAWLMEREVDGQTVYWDGGHAESFTRDPDKAVQWCRVTDAINCCHPNHYAQWGWRYVEHGFIGSTLLPQPAERPHQESVEDWIVREARAISGPRTHLQDSEALIQFGLRVAALADPTPRPAIRDVLTERTAQDQQWGGPTHDDAHVEEDWLRYIDRQRDGAAVAIEGCGPNWRGQGRQRFVKIAALAVAAIESMDRQYPDIAPAALASPPVDPRESQEKP